MKWDDELLCSMKMPADTISQKALRAVMDHEATFPEHHACGSWCPKSPPQHCYVCGLLWPCPTVQS